MSKILRLLLGDQLNAQHSWFKEVNPSVDYVMMEVLTEATYVTHHIQKIVAFFLAMRQFCEWLRQQGHRVIYLAIDDTENRQSIEANLTNLIAKNGYKHFEYQLPDEYRLDELLKNFSLQIPISSKAIDSEHFLTNRHELADFFEGKKHYLMETFYRQMRKKFQILMENGQPVGNRWNFDAENRKKYDEKHPVLPFPHFQRDVTELLQIISAQNIPSIGKIQPTHFGWAVTREEALRSLSFFAEHLLPHFGTYQDAMDSRFPFLFHSRLSFALNVKLLHPLEVVQAVIASWQEHPDRISLAQVEGFVRQIIGWREYMRGVYWAQMPAYRSLNFFDHQRPLPSFYWNGHTKMACLHDAITNSLNNAYAHHIQRLMITGNFALLAEVHPDEVDAWYLGIYIDAIEWVEITNTRGMSQYADGGLVATKPYVASANYIDKMSNYCHQCPYDKKKKTGKNACPFNSLYWHFYHRHRPLLEKNPRIAMMYQLWDKTSSAEKTQILSQAEVYLTHIEQL